jgi:hypothetical protein
MNKHLSAITAVLLIAGALAFFGTRHRSKSAGPDSSAADPKGAIWCVAGASRAGNVRDYLDCFCGPLRQSLEKTAAEMGEQKFGEYLKRLNEEIAGIAVSDPELTGPDAAKVRVEFVSRGKNEAQQHHLKLSNGTWKIDWVDEAERVRTLIPYGAEVAGEE